MTNFDIVLIDDLRGFVKPQDDALVIRTLPEALDWLAKLSPVDTIGQLWLDHDLGKGADGEIMEIIPFVNKLEELAYWDEAPQIKEILIHTSNGVGARKMIDALSRFYKLTRIPQADLDSYLIQVIDVDQD